MMASGVSSMKSLARWEYAETFPAFTSLATSLAWALISSGSDIDHHFTPDTSWHVMRGRARSSKLNQKWVQTDPFNDWPALKRTDFVALILMASPVPGLNPLRAARLETAKVPKPAN